MCCARQNVLEMHQAFHGSKSTACGSRNALEDPWDEPNESMFTRSVSPENAPDQPTYIEIEYERGDPVAIDGRRLSPATLLTNLNKVAGENGEPPDSHPPPVLSLPCCPYGARRSPFANGGSTGRAALPNSPQQLHDQKHRSVGTCGRHWIIADAYVCQHPVCASCGMRL